MAKEDPIQNIYTLSPMQSSMLFLSLMDKESEAYFEQCTFKIAGEIDASLLEKSFGLLVQRYDIFRTVFRVNKVKEPLQIVLKKRNPSIHYEEAISGSIEEFKRQDRARGFDLSKDLLIRLSLIKTGDRLYYLVFSFHHIVMDGWCLAIVFKELLHIYQALKKGEPIGLEKVTPYVDYIRWLEKQDKAAGYRKWQTYLEEYEEPTRLPGTGLSMEDGQYKLEEYSFSIDKALTAGLNNMARENQVTINTVFQTLWGLLLQKYNNTRDVVFGAVVSGRPPEIDGIETMVGLFINTVPIRINYPGQQDFSRFLKHIQEEYALLKTHEYLPLAQIQSNTSLKGNLIDHIIVFENFPLQEELKNTRNGQEASVQVLDLEMREQSNYDFNIVVAPAGEILVKFSYNASVYEKTFIETIARQFEKAVQTVVRNPHLKVEEIEILTDNEKKQLLMDFNKTETSYPTGKTIHQLFEEQVERTPGHIAVCTPEELNDIYDRLESESPVGTADDRMGTCCFKKNPYIFRTEVPLPGKNQGIILLKANHHNSVLVNRHTADLIAGFDGEKSLASIYTHLLRIRDSKGQNIPFAVYSLVESDLLEVSFQFNDNAALSYIDQWDDFSQLVKILYRARLIELTGTCTGGHNEIFDNALFGGDTADPFPPHSFDSRVLFAPRQPVSKAQVLLLGDTPGIASTGLLYLGSYLVRNGIRAYCRFYDNSRDYASMKENIEALLESIQPDVVAVSMKWFLYIARVMDMCRIIKDYAHSRHLDVKVVVGGNTASYYREEMISCDNIDYLISGDGEEPLLKICRGDTDIPNCLYKKQGNIVENPMTYIQDETNSREIYLSHLDGLLLSPYPTLFGAFFIYTHKGCLMNCLYCGGCRQAQQRTFNRKKIFRRGVEEVRKDILAAVTYTSTLQFDFDFPADDLPDYCRQIWEGIDLSNHFCIIATLAPPPAPLVERVSQTFSYVYWDFDIATLSERHRQELDSLGWLKPQPSDQQILDFMELCESYPNIEVRLNLVTGLPRFTQEDIPACQELLAKIMSTYNCFGELHWARLHAQPGAPVVDDPGKFHMHSYATTYDDFLTYSRKNFDRDSHYAGVEQMEYPYIYFKDDRLNSKVTEFYLANNRKVEQHKKDKRRGLTACRTLTYRQLNGKANRLAQLLREKGIGPGSIVGLMLERTLEIPLAILAVLKAGGAYLPIDPEAPEARIQYMLTDSGSDLLITRHHLVEKAESDTEALPGNPVPLNKPSDIVYTIYTSGTTGKSKGVLLEHQNLVNYVHWFTTAADLTPGDKTVLTSSFAFDLGYTSLYTSILNGGELHILPREIYLAAERFLDYIRRKGITYIKVTPSLFSVIVNNPGFSESTCRPLRMAAIGGEAINLKDIEKAHKLCPHLRIMNHYGPTEATIGCVATFVDFERFDHYKKHPVIGKPISNTRVYVLGKDSNLLPVGVPGELCIAGAGLARGYLNRPELTAEKFNRSYKSYGTYIFYKTGDLARWLPDPAAQGAYIIEFLGRIDNQVKIRGYRIELGEIENRLQKHPKVEKAAAVVKQPDDTKFLCAYIEPGQGAAAKTSELLRLKEIQEREHLTAPPADYVSPGSVPSIAAAFEEQTGKNPDGIAVISENRSLTFDALNRHANRVAHWLLENYHDRYKLSKKEKQRYNRQLLLYEWGMEAQEKLKSTTVFVAGAGGGASPTIMQLALAGFGTIIVCDCDVVELSNLNRQFLHDESRIGMNKALSARMTINNVNPHVKVIPRTERLTRENAAALVGDAAIIFDMFDGLESKFILSQYAFSKGIPHIISAMTDINGYAAVCHPPHSPCYHCIFDRKKWEAIVRGMENYVQHYEKNPLAVIATSLFMSTAFAVNEAIKLVLGFENPAYNKFVYFNQRGTDHLVHTPGFQAMTHAFSDHFRDTCKQQGFDWDTGWRGQFLEELTITPDPQCPVCAKKMAAEPVQETVTADSTVENNTLQSVALLMKRDVDMAAAVMGTLKAGKTYVPLDPDLPAERLSYMLEDSESRVILTDNSHWDLAEKLRDETNRNIKLLNVCRSGERQTVNNPRGKENPGQMAYILYSPNPDANPACIMETHQDLMEFAGRCAYHGENSPGGYSFSAPLLGLYGPLLNGTGAYTLGSQRPGTGTGALSSELREYLLKELPDYMIPSHFVLLDRMPLTPNGKIDRKALPEVGLKIEKAHAAPRNHLETALVDLWSEVLKIDKNTIGIDANFFELGGHSLNATILLGRVYKEFNVKFPMAEIFKAPTLESMATYIDTAVKEAFVSITPVKKKDYYALSSAQKRLYILQQMEPELTAYNVYEMFELQGKLEREKLEQIFKELIRRHDILRTSFELVDGEPVQRVHDAVDFEIVYEDSEEVGVHDFIRPFDLTRAPLLRVGLTKLGDRLHVMMVDMHHIISDGVSHGILIGDFLSLYKGSPLPALRLQYKDYSRWQQSAEHRQTLEQQEAHWLQVFSGEIPVLNMPTDYPRPAVQSFEGKALRFVLGAAETRALNAIARAEGATLFMVLLALNNVLLYKLSGQEDIVVGTPVAGRKHPDLERIIGMFVNTLALRNRPSGNKTFSAFLAEVKEGTLEALKNQDYAFEDLVERVEVQRDMSRNPLFDVMLVLQNMLSPSQELTGAELEGLKIKPYEYEQKSTMMDITLTAIEREGILTFTLEYCTRLFKEESMERFTRFFKKIAAAVVENPAIKISGIDILSGEEKKQVLFDFNDTEVDYPKDKMIHQLFEEQVEKAGDRIAVIGVHHAITYRQLNRKSDQLARLLIKKGIQPNTIVGVMLERSIEMIFAILGILKAGAAYLPIDPDYPPARKSYMLNDSGAKILLKSEIRNPKSESPRRGHPIKNSNERNMLNVPIVLNFDTFTFRNFEFVCTRDFDIGISNLGPSGLCYVIYTSGSTGKPKGVMVDHRAVVNYIWWAAGNYVGGEKIHFPLYTSISFDLTVTSLFTPLITGNATVVYRENEQEFLIERIIEEDRVGAVKLTPSHLKLLREKTIKRKPVNIKRFIVGGENLDRQLALDIHNAFEGKVEIYNEYGPTEAAVGCMIYKFDPARENGSAVPIGVPAANVQIYLLDRNREPVPAGVAAELHIAGDGIARGYLNNPELTNSKFQRGWHPLSFSASQLLSFSLYRTGDLARWLPDPAAQGPYIAAQGAYIIEFLGRCDHQVKVRGFRIEPGEIENQLLQHETVNETVVLTRKSGDGENHLCAYMVFKGNGDGDGSSDIHVPELKEFLSQKLPEYMIPSQFIRVEKIPLSPTGKVDRKALAASGTVISTGTQFAAPGSEIEKTVANTWKEILHVDKVGIHDNFFDLGGNSLKVIQLNNKLNQRLERNVSVLAMFEHVTIHTFVQYLSRLDAEQTAESETIDRSEVIEKAKKKRAGRRTTRKNREFLNE